MFRQIEHTADIGLEIEAETLEGIFSESAYGLYSLIFEGVLGDNDIEETIELKADDIESLLVKWLNELIYKFFYEAKIFNEFKIKIDTTDNTISAQVKGKKYCPKEVLPLLEIKSATYHNLKIHKIDNNYRTQVIFDV